MRQQHYLVLSLGWVGLWMQCCEDCCSPHRRIVCLRLMQRVLSERHCMDLGTGPGWQPWQVHRMQVPPGPDQDQRRQRMA